MTLNIYRTTGFHSRSVLRARLMTQVHTPEYPEDPQAFADAHDGDLIEAFDNDDTDDASLTMEKR